MRESPTRWLRAIAGFAIIVLATMSLVRHASDFSLRPLVWHFRPLPLLGALGLVVLSFGLLAGSWWSVVRGWRQGVGLAAAARAWVLTNLARYRPSHGAAVEQMANIALDVGISSSFSVGASVLPRLITLAAASAVASGLFVLNRLDASLPLVAVGFLTVAASLAAAVLLTSSDICFRISVAIHRPNAIRPVEPDALGVATLLDIGAFLAQGAALRFLAQAFLAGTDLTWWEATGSLSVAYVVGRLLPVLPSGFPVREAACFLLLRGAVGTGPALALSLLWRGVLTFTEVGAAMPFRLTRSNSRDAS
jgi:hypothetical protein